MTAISIVEPASKTRPIRPVRRKTHQTESHIVLYPDHDGEPMSDSDHQYEGMTDSKYALVNFFRDDPQVYVAANMLIYYERGRPDRRIAPDVFVVRGVGKHKRGSYKLWLEQKIPSIVFEVASPGTFRRDMRKKAIYASLQIPEYIMLDPFDGNYFGEPLQGFRLVRNAVGAYEYELMPLLPNLDGDKICGIYSQALGLEIWAKRSSEDDSSCIFRFRNPTTGEWLLGQIEGDVARVQAEKERRAAEQARRVAEQEKRTAEQEKRAAEQARRVAEQEKRLADQARLAAEAENEQLRAEIARLRQSRGES